MKTCTGCGETRSVDEFYRHRRSRDGRQARCKECQKAYTYEWRSRNPEKIREATRKRYESRGRELQYQRLYGIGEAEVSRLREAQGDRCAICGRHGAESYNGLHVDHCHGTGRVRGLLCHFCNTAIGKFDDNPALLRRAADYLERSDSERA